MVDFPNAKINLGLSILGKRADGFHDIETCMFPVTWRDILEIIPSTSCSISVTGEIPNCAPEDNLCWKAYQLLQADFDLPPVHIHLHKVIPFGAGLGGGSSNAAFTLRILASLFSLKLSKDQLAVYAAKIGSDCPFFIYNTPTLAFGRGTEFEHLEISLKGKHYALINPHVGISTSEAYQNAGLLKNRAPLASILQKDISEWSNLLTNDFEDFVFRKYPEIGGIKENLYKAGASYASLSGSGSTVFGIFNSEPELPNFPEQYIIYRAELD